MKSLAIYSIEILFALSALFGILSLVYLVSIIKAFKRLHLIKVGRGLVLLLIFLPLTLLGSGIIVGLQGYKTLTHESIIAVVNVMPVGKQRFNTTLHFPDGHTERYLLEGDQVQIDANIIKWKPYANILGLHTHYELSRISGRYSDLDEARENKLSAHSLSRERLLDLARLRVQHESLRFLMDAEYGSATYLPASKPATYTLNLSTTGLLLRHKKDG